MLYDFYVLDARLGEGVGHFERECVDDEDAVQQAARCWPDRQVGIWSAGRWVGKPPGQNRPERFGQTRSPEANRQPAARRFGRNYGV